MADPYEQGFNDGVEAAIGCCFGKPPAWKEYDTPEEQYEYDAGRADGYNSVDD